VGTLIFIVALVCLSCPAHQQAIVGLTDAYVQGVAEVGSMVPDAGDPKPVLRKGVGIGSVYPCSAGRGSVAGEMPFVCIVWFPQGVLPCAGGDGGGFKGRAPPVST
jgi:hypothetical protein